MSRARGVVAIAIAAVFTLGCQQIDRAVRGFERDPGGWSRVSESRVAMDSDVTYLGASADGLIIVRASSGAVQIWRSSR